MANQILAEHGSRTQMTITLSEMASSTAGVGQQSTIVANTDNFQIVHVFVKVTVGTTPTIDTNIYVYLIKGDGTNRSDAAGATDADWTVINARKLGVIRVNATSSDIPYYGEFVVYNPGLQWGIGIVHDTGTNLEAETGTLHQVYFVGENQEVQ